MNADDYERLWLDLHPASTSTEMTAIEIAPASGLWVALDDSARRHLLVESPPGAEIKSETHGLQVSTGKRILAGGNETQVIDLKCLDSSVIATFATVAANIVDRVLTLPHEARGEAVAGVLKEWRWFWDIDPDALSTQEAVGLFGELWFLHLWNRTSRGAVEAWGASFGARHDFQWVDRSVEVKVASGAGPVVHTIGDLLQLEDPDSGDLYLFSMSIRRDSLASNSVDSLVNAVLSTLKSDTPVRADVLEKLARRGYTPAGTKASGVTYRVVEQSLYRVEDDFPRLVRSSFPAGLPGGIVNVSYQLDMNACSRWLIPDAMEMWSSLSTGH